MMGWYAIYDGSTGTVIAGVKVADPSKHPLFDGQKISAEIKGNIPDDIWEYDESGEAIFNYKYAENTIQKAL